MLRYFVVSGRAQLDKLMKTMVIARCAIC